MSISASFLIELQETMMIIWKMRQSNGVMPTSRELALKMNLSHCAINNRIDRLLELGYLYRSPGRSARNTEIAKTIKFGDRQVPILGVCD